MQSIYPQNAKEMTSMDSSTVLTETQSMLINRRRTLTLGKIEQDTGIPTRWLSEFGRDKIDDPGFKRVALLHDYLIKA
jgi:hypothetical protein